MYRREKPINLKGSTSALLNNLTIGVNPEKRQITYGVAHKAAVNLVTTQADGQTIAHKQIICKEPSSQTHGSSMVIQAKLMQLASKNLLVITAQKGMQIFEADMSLMLYWYAFGDVNQLEIPACFGRGICGVMDNTVCVGTHEGSILVFYIPTRGTNITMSETLKGHTAAISALEADDDRMVSSDDVGNIIVWQAGDRFKQILHIKGDGECCTSLGLYRGLIVASYGDGHLRVFDMETGRMYIEAAAHARWINALDVSANGMVVTASEDSAVKIWQIKGADSQPSMDLKFSEFVSDLQLQGVKFVTDDARAFVCTGYDSNELIFYSS